MDTEARDDAHKFFSVHKRPIGATVSSSRSYTHSRPDAPSASSWRASVVPHAMGARGRRPHRERAVLGGFSFFLYESRSTLSEPRQRSARYAEKRVTAYRSRDAAIYAAARVAAYMNIRVFMCSRVSYVIYAAKHKHVYTRPSKKAAISRGYTCRRVS